MIPTTSIDLVNDFNFKEVPTKTFDLHIDRDEISGFTDTLEAVKQAVYLILNIERYEYIIYSWNYGVELASLFGKQITYVIPELERRIYEALIRDDRINNVGDFEFSHSRNKVFCKFRVYSKFGDFEAEKEVSI